MYARYSPPRRGLVSMTRAPRILPAAAGETPQQEPIAGDRSALRARGRLGVRDSRGTPNPFQRHTLHHRSTSLRSTTAASTRQQLVCHHSDAGAAKADLRAARAERIEHCDRAGAITCERAGWRHGLEASRPVPIARVSAVASFKGISAASAATRSRRSPPRSQHFARWCSTSTTSCNRTQPRRPLGRRAIAAAVPRLQRTAAPRRRHRDRCHAGDRTSARTARRAPRGRVGPARRRRPRERRRGRPSARCSSTPAPSTTRPPANAASAVT